MQSNIDKWPLEERFFHTLYGFISDGLGLGDDAALTIVDFLQFWHHNGTFLCWALGHRMTTGAHSACVRCGKPASFEGEKPGLFLMGNRLTAPEESPVGFDWKGNWVLSQPYPNSDVVKAGE